MKKLATLLLFAASAHLLADLVISEVHSDSGGGPPLNITLKIKGDKIRSDHDFGMHSGALISYITDTCTGEITYIFHQYKTYKKILASKTKELPAKTPSAGTTASPSPAQKFNFVDTGRKEKVTDSATDVFTAETPTMKITYWMAKDFPNGAAVNEQMKKLQANMIRSKMSGGPFYIPEILPSMSGLPAKMFPVKTEIVVDGQTITTTLVSAKETQLDESDFTVPAGYTEQQILDSKTPPKP